MVVDVSPRRFVLHLLDNIDLSSTTRPNPTRPRRNPANQQRTSLVGTTVSWIPRPDGLHGIAKLSPVGTEYLEFFKSTDRARPHLRIDAAWPVHGAARRGPALHQLQPLRLHYDPSRLAQAVRPVADPVGGFGGTWSRFQAIPRANVPGINLEGPGEALRSLLRPVQTGTIQSADFVTQTIALVRQTVPGDANLELWASR